MKLESWFSSSPYTTEILSFPIETKLHEKLTVFQHWKDKFPVVQDFSCFTKYGSLKYQHHYRISFRDQTLTLMSHCIPSITLLLPQKLCCGILNNKKNSNSLAFHTQRVIKGHQRQGISHLRSSFDINGYLISLYFFGFQQQKLCLWHTQQKKRSNSLASLSHLVILVPKRMTSKCTTGFRKKIKTRTKLQLKKATCYGYDVAQIYLVLPFW